MSHIILKKMAGNVKRLRNSKKWSQETLAKKSGLHRTYISSIENKNRNVSLINVKKIADALSVKPEELIR